MTIADVSPSGRSDGVHIVGLDRVREMLQQMPDDLLDVANKSVKKSTMSLLARMQKRITGNPLKSRTGQLRRSFKMDFDKGSGIKFPLGMVYTDSPYAMIHEHGGTIHAKRAYSGLRGGPYLNIPAKDNQTAAGVTRKTPRIAFNEGAHIIPINTGAKAKFAVILNGKAMFWLVKSVEIKAQLGFAEAVEIEDQNLLESLEKLMDEAIK